MSASLRTGGIARSTGNQRKLPSTPDAIAAFIATKAPEVVCVGLETGSLSVWLHDELRARGLPVIYIDPRHAKAALSMRINKIDRNDAAGLAQIVRTGWYRETHVKSGPSHLARACLHPAPCWSACGATSTTRSAAC